jgi:hypothetical protein
MSNESHTLRNRLCTFHRAPTSGFASWIELFKPGVFQYTAHLERLTDLQITSFHYIPMVDDLAVEAMYKGHQFSINMAWGGDLDLVASVDVPEEIFDEVCRHMRAFRRVWPLQLIRAGKRYERIAKGAA